MEAVERQAAGPRSAPALRRAFASPDWGGLGAWALGALLATYLALEGGGYDLIVRSEIGIAAWWLVLVGALTGALSLAGVARGGLAAFALLGAFAGWTALSLAWTESAGRTVVELARVASYLGVLALGLAAAARGKARHLLFGVTFGVALVAALGVLSRLHPAWFPENIIGEFLPGIEIESRLAYPLNYSSAVGAWAAIGIPLVLAATAYARTIPGQALAAAALPVVGFALFLATSGTGAAAAAAALAAFLILAPDRLPKLATLALGGGGAAILAAANEQREALARGLPTPPAMQQGDEVLAMAIVVCAGVALVQTGLSLALRYGQRPAWTQPTRRQAWGGLAAAAAIAIPVALAAGLPGELSDRWERFKGREGAGAESRAGQIFDPSSSGRYQFWETAADAGAAEPLTGTGAGTFELWWAREGSYAGFVRDAHSLYMESLGELGWPGLLLIGGLVLGVLGIGATRTLRSPPEARLALAAATAGAAGFAAAAALDWVWEIAALPIVFMLLAAVATAGFAHPRPSRRRRAIGGRVALGALAVAALLVVWEPLSGERAQRQSEAAVARGNLDRALSEARSAVDAQPYAASAHLQEALVLERRGNLDAAAQSAREATRKASTDWRAWLVVSRIEASRGNSGAALDAFQRVQKLNPRSGALAS